MTKIIYGIDTKGKGTIEVLPTLVSPSRDMFETISLELVRRDNPGISDENASRLSGLAADLILRDLDNQINNQIN